MEAKQALINGLIVLIVVLNGTTLVLQETKDSPDYDTCRAGSYGTWTNQTPVYFVSDFAPRLGKYFCDKENITRWCRDATATRCYYLDLQKESTSDPELILYQRGAITEGPKDRILQANYGTFPLDLGLFDKVDVSVFYVRNETTLWNLNTLFDRTQGDRKFAFNLKAEKQLALSDQNKSFIMRFTSEGGFRYTDGRYCLKTTQQTEKNIQRRQCLDMTDLQVKNNVTDLTYQISLDGKALDVGITISGPINLDPGWEDIDEYSDRIYAENHFFRTWDQRTIPIGISDDKAYYMLKPADPTLIGLWAGWEFRDTNRLKGYITPTGAPAAGKYQWNQTYLAYHYNASPNPGWKINEEGDIHPSILELRGGAGVQDFEKIDYMTTEGGGVGFWYDYDHGAYPELNYGSKRFYTQYTNMTGTKVYWNGMGSWTYSDDTILHMYGAASGTYTDTALTLAGNNNLSVTGPLDTGGMSWNQSTGDIHITGLYSNGFSHFSMLLNKSWSATDRQKVQSRFNNASWFWPFPDTYTNATGITSIRSYGAKQSYLGLKTEATVPAGTNVSIRYRTANYTDLAAWPIIVGMYDFTGGNLFPVKGTLPKVDIYESWEGSFELSHDGQLADNGLALDVDDYAAYSSSSTRLAYFSDAGSEITTLGGDAARGGGWCFVYNMTQANGNLLYTTADTTVSVNAGPNAIRCTFDDAADGTSKVWYTSSGSGDNLNVIETTCCLYDPVNDKGIMVRDGTKDSGELASWTTGYRVSDFTEMFLMQSYGNAAGNFVDGTIMAVIFINETPADLSVLNFTRYYNGVQPLWSSWSARTVNKTGAADSYDAVQVEFTLENTGGTSGLPIFKSVIVENATAGAADSCSCPGANTNWPVAMSDNCVIASTCNIGTGNITFDASAGSFTCNATVTARDMERPVTGQTVKIGSSCRLNI